MKTLILVRHAKSSWKDPTLPDRLRPLNKRGKKNAPEMGRRLAGEGIQPELMLSSPAKRAVKTAQAIAEEVGYSVDHIFYDERLYMATLAEWLEVIHNLDERLDTVMMFGHNPGLTELAVDLSAVYIENVPTAGVVKLVYDADSWKKVGKVKPASFNFDFPKKGDD